MGCKGPAAGVKNCHPEFHAGGRNSAHLGRPLRRSEWWGYETLLQLGDWTRTCGQGLQVGGPHSPTKSPRRDLMLYLGRVSFSWVISGSNIRFRQAARLGFTVFSWLPYLVPIQQFLQLVLFVYFLEAAIPAQWRGDYTNYFPYGHPGSNISSSICGLKQVTHFSNEVGMGERLPQGIAQSRGSTDTSCLHHDVSSSLHNHPGLLQALRS